MERDAQAQWRRVITAAVAALLHRGAAMRHKELQPHQREASSSQSKL